MATVLSSVRSRISPSSTSGKPETCYASWIGRTKETVLGLHEALKLPHMLKSRRTKSVLEKLLPFLEVQLGLHVQRRDPLV